MPSTSWLGGGSRTGFPGRHGRALPGAGDTSLAARTGTNALRNATLALLACLLGACAAPTSGPVPERVRIPPPDNPRLYDAREHPDRHLGAQVRWGGVVVGVHRLADGRAEAEVIEHALDNAGRPIARGASDGRFLVRAGAGVDPALLAPGAVVTVAGTIERIGAPASGTRRPRLPLVRAEEAVRWGHERAPDTGGPSRWQLPDVRIGVEISNLDGRSAAGARR